MLDRIYEVALLPELWPGILEAISQSGGFCGATLFSIDPRMKGPRSVSSGEVKVEAMRIFAEDGWAQKNTRVGRLLPMKYAGFVIDHDIMTDEEIQTDPFYSEFLQPLGIGWAGGTIISASSDDMIVFNFERWLERGPIEREDANFLDGLRPHLARASILSSRIGLDRANAATNTLELIGRPVPFWTGPGVWFPSIHSWPILSPTGPGTGRNVWC